MCLKEDAASHGKQFRLEKKVINDCNHNILTFITHTSKIGKENGGIQQLAPMLHLNTAICSSLMKIVPQNTTLTLFHLFYTAMGFLCFEDNQRKTFCCGKASTLFRQVSVETVTTSQDISFATSKYKPRSVAT